jgi:hypothetical protein
MACSATATSIRVCSREVGEVTLDHLFGWACCYLFIMLSHTSCQSPLCDLMLIFNSHWCSVVLIVAPFFFPECVHPQIAWVREF